MLEIHDNMELSTSFSFHYSERVGLKYDKDLIHRKEELKWLM